MAPEDPSGSQQADFPFANRLLESIAFGIVLQDENGRIAQANPAAQTILGLTFDQMRGANSVDPRFQTVHEDGSPFPGLDHPAMETLRTGKQVSNVIMGVFNPIRDAFTWIHVDAVPLWDESGKVFSVYTIFKDITEQREAVMLRDASEQRFQSLFTAMSEGMVLHRLVRDANGQPIDYRILDVNPAFEAQTGVTRAQVIGKLATQAYAQPVAPYLDTYSQVATSRKPTSFESYFAPLDKHFLISVFSPEPDHFATVFEDVSDRKRAEDALRSSEQRYRLLAENSHDVIWTLDIKSMKFTYVSPSVERLRGFTPSEVMSLSTEEAVTPQSARILNAALAQRLLSMAAGERPDLAVVTEIDQPHRNGSIIHTEIVTTILLDDAGQPASVLGVTRDITERKKAQEEQQLAALVFRNSSEAMLVADANNLIESVNPAFEQITGYTLDEVKGKNPKVLASGRHDKSFYESMWLDLNTAASWQGEIWNRRKDGECYLAQLSINTNYAADGSVDRRVALFSDITKKKEAVDLIWRQANFDPLTQLVTVNK